MKKNRAVDGISEGLMQARDHAKGINQDVRFFQVKTEPLPEVNGKSTAMVQKESKLLQKHNGRLGDGR